MHVFTIFPFSYICMRANVCMRVKCVLIAQEENKILASLDLQGLSIKNKSRKNIGS